MSYFTFDKSSLLESENGCRMVKTPRPSQSVGLKASEAFLLRADEVIATRARCWCGAWNSPQGRAFLMPPRRRTCARIVESPVSCPASARDSRPVPNGERAFVCLRSDSVSQCCSVMRNPITGTAACRARRDRPCRRRAAEKLDEVAASHGLTPRSRNADNYSRVRAVHRRKSGHSMSDVGSFRSDRYIRRISGMSGVRR
jgi:hypothetical protein